MFLFLFPTFPYSWNLAKYRLIPASEFGAAVGEL